MVRKYALRIISNITAGSPHQIEAVLQRNIVGRLIRLLQNIESDINIINEGVWAISNDILCSYSHNVSDHGIVTSCLETIEGMDEEISNKAVHIYFTYLYADDIEVVGEDIPNAFNLDIPPYVPYGGFNFDDIEEDDIEDIPNALNLHIPPYVSH
ncbi:hypothetical protein TSUD_172400 [Trifolium subterraneum]|uniref:Uncharacterized protein n=1 Tax=Trifolium subterraneum TaxID=3900 RepID=A0A2Z6MCJ1_TRISU|nr:hypothetical protein TSUD_172400 [Trifolium subterraneum]